MAGHFQSSEGGARGRDSPRARLPATRPLSRRRAVAMKKAVAEGSAGGFTGAKAARRASGEAVRK